MSNNSTNSQKDIRQLLLTGKWSVGKKPEGTAPIWNKFDAIFDENDLPTAFVICKDCKIIYRHSGATSQLNRHRRKGCIWQELADAPPQVMRQVGSSSKTAISPKLKYKQNHVLDVKEFLAPNSKRLQTNLLKRAIEWCCEDSLSFNILDSPRFKSFLQEIVDVGAQCGRVNVEHFLPSSTLAAVTASSLSETLKNDLKCKISQIVKYNGISAAITKNNCIYLHFIDENFQLSRTFLSLVKDEETVFDALNEYGIDPNGVNFVMPPVNNGEATSLPIRRLPCLASWIDHIVKTILNDATPSSLRQQITSCFKAADQAFSENQFEDMPTRSVSSSSISAFLTLKMICNHYYELQPLPSCPFHVIETLVTFLQPFIGVRQTLTDISPSTSELTIHKVLPAVNMLYEHCTARSNDSMLMMEMKMFAKHLLAYQRPCAIEHKVALAFDPTGRLMRQLDHESREAVFAELTRQLTLLITNNHQTSELGASSLCTGNTSSTAMILSIAEALVKLKGGPGGHISGGEYSALLELENYKRLISSAASETPQGGEQDVLLWWYRHQYQFPRLALLARRYLAIPASCGAVNNLQTIGNETTEGYAACNNSVIQYLKHALPCSTEFQ